MEKVTGADFKSATADDNKKLFIETYGCQMNVATLWSHIEKQVNNTQIREKTEFGIKDLVIGMRNKFWISYPEIFLRMNNLAEICFFCCEFRFIF